MKLLIAELETGANTFSPIPTGRQSFLDGLVTRDARDLGIDIAILKGIVVTSMNHFYAAFKPVASGIIHVNGPGTVVPDMTKVPFTKRDGNYRPKSANPQPVVPQTQL